MIGGDGEKLDTQGGGRGGGGGGGGGINHQGDRRCDYSKTWCSLTKVMPCSLPISSCRRTTPWSWLTLGVHEKSRTGRAVRLEPQWGMQSSLVGGAVHCRVSYSRNLENRFLYCGKMSKHNHTTWKTGALFRLWRHKSKMETKGRNTLSQSVF